MSNRPEPKIEQLWRMVDQFKRASYLEKPHYAELALGIACEVLSDLNGRIKNLERINGVREHDGR